MPTDSGPSVRDTLSSLLLEDAMRSALCALSLLLASCTSTGDDTSGGGEDSADDVDPLSWSVLEAGPLGTGVRRPTLTYVTPDGRDRELPLTLYYPTEETDGDSPSFQNGYPPAEESLLLDAAPAAPVHAGGYPVVVHSHGHASSGGEHQLHARTLASHGFVVACPDHVPNIFPSEETPPAHFLDRPSDVSAALDYLEGLPGDDLLSQADTAAAMVSGHSRGGSTVWGALGATYQEDTTAYCQPAEECTPAMAEAFAAGTGDGRLVAGVLLASGIRDSLYGSEGHRSTTAPMMVMTGTLDSDGQPTFDAVDHAPVTWIELEGACHGSFAYGLEVPACDEEMPDEDAFAAVGAYLLAFARRHILGDEGDEVVGVLDGSVEVDARATLQHKDN